MSIYLEIALLPDVLRVRILKASRNLVLRGHWKLSRKSSSKSELLGALPLRILFCPAWGERRGQTKDSYAKGRLKTNAYFDVFYIPHGQNSRILLRKSVGPKGQLQNISWGVFGAWVLRLKIWAKRYNSYIPSSYNFRCKMILRHLFSMRNTSKTVYGRAAALKDSISQSKRPLKKLDQLVHMITLEILIPKPVCIFIYVGDSLFRNY